MEMRAPFVSSVEELWDDEDGLRDDGTTDNEESDAQDDDQDSGIGSDDENDDVPADELNGNNKRPMEKGIGDRRGERLKRCREALTTWRRSCWKRLYSECCFGPDILLPDKTLTRLASRARIRSVADMDSELSLPWDFAELHGTEVLRLLERTDEEWQGEDERRKEEKKAKRRKKTEENRARREEERATKRAEDAARREQQRQSANATRHRALTANAHAQNAFVAPPRTPSPPPQRSLPSTPCSSRRHRRTPRSGRTQPHHRPLPSNNEQPLPSLEAHAAASNATHAHHNFPRQLAPLPSNVAHHPHLYPHPMPAYYYWPGYGAYPVWPAQDSRMQGQHGWNG